MSTLLKRSAPCLLKAAVNDGYGYDYGLSLTYLEGGNKVLLARQGFSFVAASTRCIELGEYPSSRFTMIRKDCLRT